MLTEESPSKLDLELECMVEDLLQVESDTASRSNLLVLRLETMLESTTMAEK